LLPAALFTVIAPENESDALPLTIKLDVVAEVSVMTSVVPLKSVLKTSEVDAVTVNAPVSVTALAPETVQFPAPVVEVVMDAKDRAKSILRVPPSSITIVLPAGIELALTVVRVVIVV
jgi:hypothetical protein